MTGGKSFSTKQGMTGGKGFLTKQGMTKRKRLGATPPNLLPSANTSNRLDKISFS